MNKFILDTMCESFLLFICLIIFQGNAVAADEGQSSGQLKYIPGPVNAEDILPLGDTEWLIASGLNGQLSNTDGNGHIYLVNRESRTFQVMFPGRAPRFDQDKKMFSACPGPINPNDFSAHGLALQRISSGRFHLYVTSHGAREAVEVFEIRTQNSHPAISWTGCIPLPEEVFANSVAILADGGFVATSFFDPTVPGAFNDIFQGKITGSIYEWHPGGEVQAIPGTELSGANGIAVTPDDKWVYAAATGTREIIRFDRTKNPVALKRIHVSIQPDNIRWGDDGLLYTVGSNYVPPDACENPPCETGWSVIRMVPETMETEAVTGADQTAVMQNASAALSIDQEIWIGTHSGDRIGYLPKP